MPNNARRHSADQIASIAASIKEWGWTTPILVDEADLILAGHARVLAAKSLKAKTVPVIVASGWTQAQKRAYALADNKLPLEAEWDTGLLQIELGELKLGGFDVGLAGFSPAEFDALLAGHDFAPNLDPEAGMRVVGADDVNSAKEGLDKQFSGRAKQDIAEVECPHCGALFGIEKSSL